MAVNVTLVPEQIAPAGLAAMLTLAGRFAFTFIVMVFDVAGFPVAQVMPDVSMQVTLSPLINVELVKVDPIPELLPFTCHWNDGLPPPLVGVAVNVTDVPVQTAPEGLAAMLTLTGSDEFTETVTEFEFTHPVAAIVSVNVYVVVEAGFASGSEIVAELKPVVGDQE